MKQLPPFRKTKTIHAYSRGEFMLKNFWNYMVILLTASLLATACQSASQPAATAAPTEVTVSKTPTEIPSATPTNPPATPTAVPTEPPPTSTPTPEPLPAISGAMYRGGPQRTGNYHTLGVPQLAGEKWKFETGDEVWSSPVVADNVVYFGSDDGHLYAVDIETGHEQWGFKTEKQVRSSPAIVDDVVYFDSYDGYLYAVEAPTGELKWKFDMTVDMPDTIEIKKREYDDYTSSPVVVDGVVYIGSRNPLHGLFAVDAETGQEIWNFQPTGVEFVRSSPAVFGDTVYFGGDMKTLYALDIRTGEQKWVIKTEGIVNYGPAVSNEGVIYFVSKDGHIYAADSETGEINWQTFLTRPDAIWATGSPAIGNNGLIYTGSSEYYKLIAIRQDNGEVAWEFEIPNGYVWSSPIFVDGMVYVGGGGKLWAVNAETGEEIWHYETKGGVYSSPVAADGVVYVGSSDNYLYALN
jgi:outer membrane protein assembly factor BamB